MTVVWFVFPAVLAALISYALTPLAGALSRRWNAMDMPEPRKVHALPIPRLGGIAVVAAIGAVLAVMCAFPLPGMQALPHEICIGMLLGALPVLLVSLRDDVRPLRALPKFLAQFAGAGVAAYLGIRLGAEVHLFGETIHLGWLAIPITLVWIVGVTNAFNIVDGLDGLSAGLAMISALSLSAIALSVSRYGLASASLVFAGALLGFLPRNLYPARIFLGDTGATAVGFGLACLALKGGSTLSAGMAVLVPIVVMGVPVAETLISMARRLVRKLSRLPGGGIFEADRQHIHHRLLAMGISHARAVWTLYGVGLALAAVGIFSLFLSIRHAVVLLVTMVAAAFIGIARVGYDEFGVMRRGVVLKVYETPMLHRALFPVFVDIGLVIAAIYGAVVLKYDDWSVQATRPMAQGLLTLLPATTVTVFWAFRLYRGSWRHMSVEDLGRSSAACAVAATLGFVLYELFLNESASVTFFLIYALLLLLLVNGSRASLRVLSHWKRRSETAGDTALIYGAGRVGTMALREIIANRAAGLRPVGFIDDDPGMTGKTVNGYPVLGTVEKLAEIASRLSVGVVVIASRELPQTRRDRLLSACRQGGIRVTRFHVEFEALDSGRRRMAGEE
jgi:UDP-GlcNAc:undecaprenyl-phosphate/decaprenyl-phosphate GlcNAc-1-phosphate transferase